MKKETKHYEKHFKDKIFYYNYDNPQVSNFFHYILTRDKKYLSIRVFSDDMKQKVYQKQKVICLECKKYFELNERAAILHLSTKEEKQMKKIAKCYVKTTTKKNLENKSRSLLLGVYLSNFLKKD